MDSRALIVNVARGLVALAILAVFLNNLISQIKNVSLVTQTLSVERRHYLVPPALTFCITRQVTYTFTLEVYGNVVAT
ncbi:245_t:CDS:1, partial [Scutellospora calospora]